MFQQKLLLNNFWRLDGLSRKGILAITTEGVFE